MVSARAGLPSHHWPNSPRSHVDLTGPLQLSDELSKQAGRDLVKYTQQGGRVTVPAKVTGSADDLHVGIETGDLAKRAVTNAASEQAKKLLQRLGGSAASGSGSSV